MLVEVSKYLTFSLEMLSIFLPQEVSLNGLITASNFDVRASTFLVQACKQNLIYFPFLFFFD